MIILEKQDISTTLILSDKTHFRKLKSKEDKDEATIIVINKNSASLGVFYIRDLVNFFNKLEKRLRNINELSKRKEHFQ